MSYNASDSLLLGEPVECVVAMRATACYVRELVPSCTVAHEVNEEGLASFFAKRMPRMSGCSRFCAYLKPDSNTHCMQLCLSHCLCEWCSSVAFLAVPVDKNPLQHIVKAKVRISVHRTCSCEY